MELTKTEITAANYLFNEPDRVVVFGGLGDRILKGYTDHGFNEAPGEENFLELFDAVEEFHLSENQFHEYLDRMFLIKRKEDGKLFGLSHWVDISSNDPQFESNGSQFGVEINTDDWTEEDWYDYPSPYVFLPVVPFTITGYKLA